MMGYEENVGEESNPNFTSTSANKQTWKLIQTHTWELGS